MSADQALGGVIIFAGPHGAGKDTLEGRFREEHPDAARIVRHITRIPDSSEVPGTDYYFISDTEFDAIAAQDGFIEHAAYVGCQSGTAVTEVRTKTESSRVATITANFEDGLKLRERLTALGLTSVCLFISPCSYEAMLNNPELYASLLRERMLTRARSSDLVDGRIARAMRYRELYISNQADAAYVENANGHTDDASRAIARIAIAHTLISEQP